MLRATRNRPAMPNGCELKAVTGSEAIDPVEPSMNTCQSLEIPCQSAVSGRVPTGKMGSQF